MECDGIGCDAMIDEQNWRLDSQRKEIERLRADKLALIEMLERVREYLTTEENEDSWIINESLAERIAILLTKTRG